MKLGFLGGAMEVGGSCIYLRTGKFGIVMDCGIRQGGAVDVLPDLRMLQEQGGVDAILVSHAHMDHIGSLPILSKAYPAAPIYMTTMTQDLSRVLLYDSLKIMSRWEDEIPHYTEPDVIDMLDRIVPVHYQTPVDFLEGIRATFYPAGHIAGAAGIYLETEEGTLFYSGDFSSFAQRTIEGARFPKLRPDITILESTYGNRLHSNRQVEENRLIDLVAECIAQKKRILIPAFALGRSQEVLLILRSAIQNGAIPKVPIYVDGMIRDINRMYIRNPTYLKSSLARRIMRGSEPFYTDEIVQVMPSQNRDELLEKKGPLIFVASSGMLTGGPSSVYAAKIAPDENGCIILTGYQDEESPGRMLLNLLEETEDRYLKLNDVTVPVQCQIAQIGLSAHADKSEICALADTLSARRVFLVHGDTDAISELGTEMSGDYRRQVYIPKCGELVDIIIGNKRKQLDRRLAISMEVHMPFSAENAEELWDFWTMHMPGKPLTIQEIFYLWTGEQDPEEEELEDLRNELLDSEMFAMDNRRMYMFLPINQQEMDVLHAQPPETAQQLEPILRHILEESDESLRSPRKFGFYPQERRFVISYDFPDSIPPEAFESVRSEFEDQTGWDVVLSDSVNHQAASTLLSQAFGSRLGKISTHIDRKYYEINLTGFDPEDEEKMRAIHDTTGWQVILKGASLPGSSRAADTAGQGSASPDTMFVPAESISPKEQNTALAQLNGLFSGNPSAPYKIGIKNDHIGKFLELSFLTPAQGIRIGPLLQQAADTTGWRLRVSDTVNQNKLTQILTAMCADRSIPLLKNPAWLPQRGVFQLRTNAGVPSDALQELSSQFEADTGCVLEVLQTA